MGATGGRVMTEPTITRDEFERNYAARSGTTVSLLRRFHKAVPCLYCDYELCEGWKYVPADDDATNET